ncbi:hypothetical protein LTR36_006207 [Oleoguttula mirabilis]|uniref:Uncharacterized protein n=1 Tax=Oleoguttula mirabilis TaxID=1507867 RepID=A0AAV9JCG3_9PEZI|nr:hypothetical protein LTR36_006207 [Oleoguttula mirabilis]
MASLLQSQWANAPDDPPEPMPSKKQRGKGKAKAPLKKMFASSRHPSAAQASSPTGSAQRRPSTSQGPEVFNVFGSKAAQPMPAAQPQRQRQPTAQEEPVRSAAPSAPAAPAEKKAAPRGLMASRWATADEPESTPTPQPVPSAAPSAPAAPAAPAAKKPAAKGLMASRWAPGAEEPESTPTPQPAPAPTPAAAAPVPTEETKAMPEAVVPPPPSPSFAEKLDAMEWPESTPRRKLSLSAEQAQLVARMELYKMERDHAIREAQAWKARTRSLVEKVAVLEPLLEEARTLDGTLKSS